MRKSVLPGAPVMRSGSWVTSGAKRRTWRTSDGKTHPVSVRRIVPA